MTEVKATSAHAKGLLYARVAAEPALESFGLNVSLFPFLDAFVQKEHLLLTSVHIDPIEAASHKHVVYDVISAWLDNHPYIGDIKPFEALHAKLIDGIKCFATRSTKPMTRASLRTYLEQTFEMKSFPHFDQLAEQLHTVVAEHTDFQYKFQYCKLRHDNSIAIRDAVYAHLTAGKYTTLPTDPAERKALKTLLKPYLKKKT
ncbi:Hypothetical protein POVN_LOCUS155 [uncultured virus]|nr:Hypothetical protein POVN_LOCUS155 [uncultured virus]